MPQPHPTLTDRWRVIIPNSSASEILILEEPNKLSLPEVNIPQHQRVAWHLNAEVRRNWNLDVISIVPVETSDSLSGDAVVQYHVVEPLTPNAAPPRGLRWTSISALTPKSLPDAEDHHALRAFLAILSSSTNKDTPFGHLGWFGELAAWLREAIAPFSFEWDHGFTQFQSSASFSLIRFGTKPRALWFKAVGDPNTREFRITQALANRYSEFVPRILAVRSDWNAWLAEECMGRSLNEIMEIELWRNASRALAELQIRSAAGAEELLRAGAHDLQTMFSLPAVNRFFTAAETLMQESIGTTVPEILLTDLPAMKAEVLELLARAKNSGIPDALGHLDLNSGNAIVSPERCVYLDWAEAYIGPPFLTLEYFLQSFRRSFGRQSPQEDSVVEAYLTTWQRSAPSNHVRETWAISPALAVFAYAQRCLIAVEPYGMGTSRFTDYLRALLRRLKRELLKCAESKAGAHSCP
jgi:hypothetical protein